MAMRSVVSRTSIRRLMEGNFQGLRRFSRVLSVEELAKQAVHIHKMEKERYEKLKKDRAESDKEIKGLTPEELYARLTATFQRFDKKRSEMLKKAEKEKADQSEGDKANPDAKSMANKEIHNWPKIAMLCGRDRSTGEGVETFDKGAEAMADEEISTHSIQSSKGREGVETFDEGAKAMADEEISTHSIQSSKGREGVETFDEGAEAMADEEISTHSIQSSKGKGIPSTSSARKVQEPSKKTKKDALANAVQEVAAIVKQYFESKTKKEDTRPTGMMIYEVVSKVEGLTENEIFRATQRLMHDNIEEFDLLQGLPHDQKKRWIQFLLNN